MTTQVHTAIYNVHLKLYGQIRSKIPKNGITIRPADFPDVRWVTLADASIFPKGTQSNRIKCFIKSIHDTRQPPKHKIIHLAIPLDFQPNPDNVLRL